MKGTAAPSSWTIRLAGYGDARLYAQTAERLFRQTYGHDADHALVMDSHCARVFDAAVITAELGAVGVTALVAEAGAGMIGLAQLRMREDLAEVERFYIDPHWHGTGLAQALMAEVRGTARGLGARALQLGVWTMNERAIAFYRRQGFVSTGTVEFVLAGMPQADLLMRLDRP